MKLIKFFFWFVIVCLLATLVYQNLAYFMTTTVLTLDLKIRSWRWEFPELQTGIYFAVCFILGLLFSGYKALTVKFRLGREIKSKNAIITRLENDVNTLKTELDVFKHDPYIKKGYPSSKDETPSGDLPPGATADNAAHKDDE